MCNIYRGASLTHFFSVSALPASTLRVQEAQRLAYTEAWLYDRDRILNELKQQNPNSTAQANLLMYITACDQATGSETCAPNGVASTWFWFTIMTTMGYGMCRIHYRIGLTRPNANTSVMTTIYAP
jgi:hypothetical protein